MRATFQPTGYAFEFNDEFFVDATRTAYPEGTRPRGVFATFADAHDFAVMLQSNPDTSATYIYTRTEDHGAWHRGHTL